MGKFSNLLAGLGLPLLVKSHVKGYTRSDGTAVAEHDDKRQKAAPPPGGDKGGEHPNVVGKIHDHKIYSRRDGGKPGDGDPTHPSTVSVGFAGKHYQPTGKTGASIHDQTPVHQFEAEDGHTIWADKDGRAHADDTSEVQKLRHLASVHDAETAKAGGIADGPAKGAGKKPKAKAEPAPDAPAPDAPAAEPEGKGAEVTEESLKSHAMFSESDLSYFVGKGYTPAEVKEIWDRDAAAGHKPVTHKEAPDVVGVASNPDLYKALPTGPRLILPSKVAPRAS